MSPKPFCKTEDAKIEMKVRLTQDLHSRIAPLIERGKFKYFTDFTIEALEEKLKRELRNLKYKGKRNGNS